MEPEPEEQLDTTATEGGSSGHQMQIFVCTTTGRTIALSVHGSDTGAEVKALIQAAEGVPPEQQGLFFGKEQLEDDRKLADCGVPKEGTLRLKLISGDGSGSAASGLTERSSSQTSKQQLRERGASFIRSDGRTFNSAAGLFDRADTSETGSGSALAKGMYREEEDEALCNINLGSCTKGTAMITLCLIDLGHVFLTWLNMWSLAHEQEEKFCGNTTVQANDTGAHEFDNLKENARTCMWLYTFKVVTHFSLVCLRMLCNRGLVTPSDNTNRWRVTQDWFIAMTFNSFMMLFVFLFVETDQMGNPWKLVQRSNVKLCRVKNDTQVRQRMESISHKTDAERGTGEMGNVRTRTRSTTQMMATIRQVDSTPLLGASSLSPGPEPEPELEPGPEQIDSTPMLKKDEVVYIMHKYFKKIFPEQEQPAFARNSIELLTQEPQPDTLQLGQIQPKIEIKGWVLQSTLRYQQRVPHITSRDVFMPGDGWDEVTFSASSIYPTDDAVWREDTKGLLDIFARIGHGGSWDLCASYVMLVNIICTVYATLVNIKALHCAEGDMLSIASLITVGVHFVVALWLYMFTKILQTQKRHICRSVLVTLLGLVDVVRLALVGLLANTFSSPQTQTLWHPPIWYGGADRTDIDILWSNRWQNIARVWIVAELAAMFMQGCTTIHLGLELNRLQRHSTETSWRESRELGFIERSNAFQARTFGTWVIPFVLLWLERPFRSNLLAGAAANNGDQHSPFRRLYARTSIANLAIACVTICRFVSGWICAYVAVAYVASPWGLTRGNTCEDFPCNIATVIAVSTLFVLQALLGFWFSCMQTHSLRQKLASFFMLLLCILDALVVLYCSYYSACIAFTALDGADHSLTKEFLECEDDFKIIYNSTSSSRTNDKVLPPLSVALAYTVLALFVCRILTQAGAFAARRMSHTDEVWRPWSPQNPDGEQFLPCQTALANGAIHGCFLLFATFTNDIDLVIAGRWSPMQEQPHWTNGIVQLLSLMEKTAMGYLLLESDLVFGFESSTWCTGSLLLILFSIQTLIQVGTFWYKQSMHPARPQTLQPGDHVIITEDAGDIGVCSCCSRKTCEVIDIMSIPDAQAIVQEFANKEAALQIELGALGAQDMQQQQQVERDLKQLRERKKLADNLMDPARENHDDVSSKRHLVTIEQYTIDAADVTAQANYVGPIDGSGQLVRVKGTLWSFLCLGLGFLDWFHIIFNFANLNFIVEDSAKVFGDSETQRRKKFLAHVCMGMYLLRAIVQPAHLLLQSLASCALASYGQGVSFTDLWDSKLRLSTAAYFNTFLMLPAMMFARNPFRDSAKTVRESYVKLGAEGYKDYLVGLLLFLMVVQKSLNGALIVEWLVANANVTRDAQEIASQYIGMSLLIAHGVVTVYVMMVPKLAHGQGGSVSKGMLLLTIALVDWMNLIFNLMSLVYISNDSGPTDDNSKSSTVDQCQHKETIEIVAIAAICFFVARVAFQAAAFLYMRASRGPLARQLDRNSMHGMRWTLGLVNSIQTEQALKLQQWRDEFQALTFNSWMMIPALLFIEKPYRYNLLHTGELSPFRRKQHAHSAYRCSGGTLTGFMYTLMVCKKGCLLYVNTQRLTGDCIASDSGGRWVTVTALVCTIIHSFLWFYTLRQMGVCSERNRGDPNNRLRTQLMELEGLLEHGEPTEADRQDIKRRTVEIRRQLSQCDDDMHDEEVDNRPPWTGPSFADQTAVAEAKAANQGIVLDANGVPVGGSE